MLKTLDQCGWYSRSRLKGACRYAYKQNLQILIWVTALVLGMHLISILIAATGMADYSIGGVESSIGSVLAVTFAYAFIVAGKQSTFLLRFGTPRFSVWLGSLITLISLALAMLLSLFVVNVAVNYLTLALSAGSAQFSVDSYLNDRQGAALIAGTLSRTLSQLPMTALWTVEWSAIFYLLGCCMRRNKAITLTVLIGGPLVFWLLTLLPMVRDTLAVMESGNSGDITISAISWMQWFTRAAQFVTKNWQWLQGAAALAALPLSYWCMRTTKQP